MVADGGLSHSKLDCWNMWARGSNLLCCKLPAAQDQMKPAGGELDAEVDESGAR